MNRTIIQSDRFPISKRVRQDQASSMSMQNEPNEEHLFDRDLKLTDHSEFAHFLDLAKSGDDSAMGQLYEASQKYLLLIANQDLNPQMLQKFGASDMVQQSMMIASNKIQEFRGKTKGEFFSWIRQILINECRQTTRRYRGTAKRDANREQTISENSKMTDGLLLSDPHLTPSSTAAAEEQVKLVQVAMQKLSERERQVIEMRNWKELSFEEIGNAIGKSTGAARKLWSRAIDSLEIELKKLKAI